MFYLSTQRSFSVGGNGPISVPQRGYRSTGKVFSFKFGGSRMNVMLGPDNTVLFQGNCRPAGGSDDHDLGWEQCVAMTKMDLALRETERSHPVAFILFRKAAQDFEKNGYSYRAGDFVLLALCATLRMDEQFEHPGALQTPGSRYRETRRYRGASGLPLLHRQYLV